MIDENEFVIFGWGRGEQDESTTDIENSPGKLAINRRWIIEVRGFDYNAITVVTYNYNYKYKTLTIHEPFDAVMKHLNKRSQFQSIPSVKKCAACHDFPFFEWLDCRGENNEETYSVRCTCGFGKKLPFPIGTLSEVVKSWNEFCGEDSKK